MKDSISISHQDNMRNVFDNNCINIPRKLENELGNETYETEIRTNKKELERSFIGD